MHVPPTSFGPAMPFVIPPAVYHRRQPGDRGATSTLVDAHTERPGPRVLQRPRVADRAGQARGPPWALAGCLREGGRRSGPDLKRSISGGRSGLLIPPRDMSNGGGTAVRSAVCVPRDSWGPCCPRATRPGGVFRAHWQGRAWKGDRRRRPGARRLQGPGLSPSRPGAPPGGASRGGDRPRSSAAPGLRWGRWAFPPGGCRRRGWRGCPHRR